MQHRAIVAEFIPVIVINRDTISWFRQLLAFKVQQQLLGKRAFKVFFRSWFPKRCIWSTASSKSKPGENFGQPQPQLSTGTMNATHVLFRNLPSRKTGMFEVEPGPRKG